MVIGDKIRGIRSLKGLSQENMANMLSLSLLTYGDIERGKKDITVKRLEEISGKLGVSVIDILMFEASINSFFEKEALKNPRVSVSTPDFLELKYKMQIQELELAKLKAEKEKAELEVRYWKEKYVA